MSETAAEEGEAESREERRARVLSDGFEDMAEPFADDDCLLSAADADEALDCLAAESAEGRNYLEEDNFERELGSPADDPFAEDFAAVARHEVVDVIGDDRAGRPVVVVYAHRLPSNKNFDHALLLRYLMRTLDQFVNQDYTIVYFHYGLKSYNKPPIQWLVKMYKILDRRYKKNLKALYLVHPTKFIRFVWNVFKPVISAKFERKLHYVNFLHELDEFVRIDTLGLPAAVQDHDKELLKVRRRSPLLAASRPEVLANQQFGVSLSFILRNNADSALPPIVVELVEFLRAQALTTEGLFRRSANLAQLKQVQRQIDRGDSVDFGEFNNVHLPAALLKTFLRELTEPLMTFRLYALILQLNDVPQEARVGAVKKLVSQLPDENLALLKYIIGFLTEVMAKSDLNMMNANNLSVVFGPNLAWPQGQQVSLAHLQHLNNFCYRLLTNYDSVFG